MPKRTSDNKVKGAGGLVFNKQGQVLLLANKQGEWLFPKGHIDNGESHLETALREVAEETGIIATCPDPSFMCLTRYQNSEGIKRQISWFAFSCDVDARLDLEPGFCEGGFFSPKDAIKKLSFKNDKILLKTMLDWWQRNKVST